MKKPWPLATFLAGALLCISAPAHALPTMSLKSLSKSDARRIGSQKIALVIGINRYKRSHWKPLKYAGRDARRFLSLLRWGGFSKVLSLTTSPQTTKASLQRALTALKKLNVHAQDTVVIYVSAHGTVVGHSPTQKGRRYIITSDTDEENIAGTALSVQWLRQRLSMFPSRRKALILATCHTGKVGSKSRRPSGQKGLSPLSPLPYSTTTLILNAASYQYSAYESRQLRSDIYTHYLLKCIRKLSGKKKKRVSAIEAHSCSVRKTYRYVMKHRNERQLPGLQANVTGLNTVYLVGHPHDTTASLTASSGAKAPRDRQLTRKGSHAILQLKHGLLERYNVKLYRGKKLVESFDIPGDLVMVMKPGTYGVRYQRRRDRRVAKGSLSLQAGSRILLAAPEMPGHTIDIGAGFGMLGQAPLQAAHPSLRLGYQLHFLGLGLQYQLASKPFQKLLEIQRLSLQLTLGLPVRLSPGWVLFGGGLLRAGAAWVSSPQAPELQAALSLGAAAVTHLSWWPWRRIGIRLGAYAGLDYTPLQARSGISFDWNASLSVLFKLF